MQAGLTRSSCNRCRSKKLRCERQQPDDKHCDRCRRAGVDCVFGQSRRGRRPSNGSRANTTFHVTSASINSASPSTASDFVSPGTASSGPNFTPPEQTGPIDDVMRSLPPAWSMDDFMHAAADENWQLGPNNADQVLGHPNHPPETIVPPSGGPQPSDANTELHSAFSWEDLWTGYGNGHTPEQFQLGHISPPSLESTNGQMPRPQLRPHPDQFNGPSSAFSPTAHSTSMRSSSSHSRTSSDWFSHHFRELSDLDMELVQYNTHLSGNMEAPQKCLFEYLNAILNQTQKLCAILDALIYQSRSHEARRQSQASSNSNSDSERYGRNSGSRSFKRRKHSNLAQQLPYETPLNVATLIGIMATYERLIGIYKTSLDRLLIIMRMKLKNTPGALPRKRESGFGFNAPSPSDIYAEHDQNYSLRRTSSEQPRAAPPWSYVRLPGLALGAFQHTDPQLQLDAILHISATLLRRAGLRVEALVLGGVSSPTYQQRPSLTNTPDSDAMSLENDRGSDSSDGDGDGRSKSSRNFTPRDGSGEEATDDEEMDEDDSARESASGRGKRRCKDKRQAHPDTVVNALLQRVRKLEREVTKSFGSLQDALMTMP